METENNMKFDPKNDHKWSRIRRFDAGHLALAIVVAFLLGVAGGGCASSEAYVKSTNALNANINAVKIELHLLNSNIQYFGGSIERLERRLAELEKKAEKMGLLPSDGE